MLTRTQNVKETMILWMRVKLDIRCVYVCVHVCMVSICACACMHAYVYVVYTHTTVVWCVLCHVQCTYV